VLGRPLVETLDGSQIHNLKELCLGSTGRSEIQILFVFWRQLNKIRYAARGPGGVRPGHGTCHRLDEVRSCLISAIDPRRAAIPAGRRRQVRRLVGLVSRAIPLAEELYAEYLQECEAEEKDR